MITKLFLRGRLQNQLTPDDRQAIDDLADTTFQLGARQTLVNRGQHLDSSFYLVDGAMIRTIDDKRGYRQIVGVQLSGDFVDLHGYPMKRLDHSVIALTDVTLAEVPHAAISGLIGRRPHIAPILWYSTLLDAAMHREWIFRLGRLNAEGRIAHLIAELIERLRFIDQYDGRNFPIPLLQRDYAEACGITPVHANRSFRTLKERGVLNPLGDGRMEIIDEVTLRKLGEFEPDYLYGDGGVHVSALRN